MGNRTVLDTNTWIDCFISRKTRELTNMIDSKEVVFLRSMPSSTELKRVLARDKFKKYNFNINDVIRLHKTITEYIETQEIFKDCPDPKDNFLFDLAIQGNANYLVSRDKTVLATPFPTKNKNIKSMKFADFKKEIEK
jgi:putative PIN family toxin of toxin-antitoxin system